MNIAKFELDAWNNRKIITIAKNVLFLGGVLLGVAFLVSSLLKLVITELKQPRRRRQQKPHKFAYLTMKNSILARFARAFFYFLTFCRRSRSFYDVK